MSQTTEQIQKSDIKDILENSVERHMIADVDIGCYLSSGIDSSILATIMQKKSMKKINTFSFGFDNPIYDESILASKIRCCMPKVMKLSVVPAKDTKQ